MARQLFVLNEVIAILESAGAKQDLVERFRARAEAVLAHKPERTIDDVSVASGFGVKSQQGTVDLTLNDQRTQMDTKKAREIGFMLIQAAEAAESDQIFVMLLKRLGIEGQEHFGRILMDLREIRHGTRDVSSPS